MGYALSQLQDYCEKDEIGDNMHVPEWVRRDLGYIDPRYRIFCDEEVGTYDILLDGKIVDTTPALNSAFLNYLRFRKWLGRQLFTDDDTPQSRAMKEQLILKKDAADATKRKQELAIDMTTEGLMKMHKMETSKTFS